MKLLFENWRGYLNEIGEGSLKPYEFTYDKDGDYEEGSGDTPTYSFDTENNSYNVEFAPSFTGVFGDVEDSWNISFDTWQHGAEQTHEGSPLRIMSTVLKIIKNFISSPQSRGVRAYSFEGVSQKDQDYAGIMPPESQRTKMYMRYLKKHMPEGTEIKRITNNIISFKLPTGGKGEE